MHNEREIELAIENGHYALYRITTQHQKLTLDRGDIKEYIELLETHEVILTNQRFLAELYKAHNKKYDRE